MAGDELQGLPNTLVSSVWAVMHFLKEKGSQPKCIGYGNFAVMQEETLVWQETLQVVSILEPWVHRITLHELVFPRQANLSS
jgi:hypothetical protein